MVAFEASPSLPGSNLTAGNNVNPPKTSKGSVNLSDRQGIGDELQSSCECGWVRTHDLTDMRHVVYTAVLHLLVSIIEFGEFV